MSSNIIIPLVIFVLLAAIVVIMVRSGKFSSKRKKGADNAALDNAPKQEIDYIASAEKMLEQQRFDDAILELKIGAQKSPNNNKIDLKLLSIYALVNNDFEFKTLYDRIMASSDAETIEAANRIKQDKESELAQTANSAAFNDDLLIPAPPVSEPSPDDFNSESFDFDQPSEAVDTAPNDQAWMPEETAHTAEASFDFDPSDMAFPEDATDSKGVAGIPTETNSTADLDFPSQSDDAAPFAMPSESDAATDMPSEDASTAMPSMDADEMDWEFPSTNDNAQADDTPTQADESSVAFDSSMPTTESDSIPLQSQSHTDLEDINLEWDDNLSLSDSEKEAENADLSGIDELDTQTAISVNEQPVEKADFDELTTPSSDEFNFDTDHISDDSDLSALEPDEHTQGKHSLSGISSESLADLDNKEPLEFVKEIDSAQLTLDLAEQYLEIGEYDSAKRLVREVALGNATDAQKARAEEILELIY